jgi:GAF domain-containing protein
MPAKKTYDELYAEFQGFLRAYDPPLGIIAKMATLCTMVAKRISSFTFVGFYLIQTVGSTQILEVGPYQGPVLACGRIGIGEGVCGQAIVQRTVLNVPDVTLFPGYIACDDETLSELVIPLYRGEELLGVLDIDARDLAFFQQSDIDGLSKLLTLL